MKVEYKNYSLESKFYVTLWIWRLLPSIEVSWDNVYACVQFSFLCFTLFIDVTNETKLSEWSAKFDAESFSNGEDARDEEEAD